MIKIVNWDKWQSYRKDRGTPPWIKIHRNLMSNPEWATLSDAEKGQLVSIWITAADKNGEITADKNIIKKMCMLDNAPDINKFIQLGFLTKERQPHDAPEAEAYSTEEEEKESIVDFEGFWKGWESYKTGKGSKSDANSAYLKALKKIAHEDLITARDNYCKFCESTDCNTKNVFRWLKKEGWEDDHTIPNKGEANGNRHNPHEAMLTGYGKADIGHG